MSSSTYNTKISSIDTSISSLNNDIVGFSNGTKSVNNAVKWNGRSQRLSENSSSPYVLTIASDKQIDYMPTQNVFRYAFAYKSYKIAYNIVLVSGGAVAYTVPVSQLTMNGFTLITTNPIVAGDDCIVTGISYYQEKDYYSIGVRNCKNSTAYFDLYLVVLYFRN